MKLLFGLMVALAITIAWQTSVLSEEEQGQIQGQQTEQIQRENAAAGRVPLDDADCD
jgi:hypothetical protein